VQDPPGSGAQDQHSEHGSEQHSDTEPGCSISSTSSEGEAEGGVEDGETKKTTKARQVAITAAGRGRAAVSEEDLKEAAAEQELEREAAAVAAVEEAAAASTDEAKMQRAVCMGEVEAKADNRIMWNDFIEAVRESMALLRNHTTYFRIEPPT
jgi:Mg-chelatase subunit ChlI